MQAMNALKFSALRQVNVSKTRWVATTTRYTRQYKTPTVAAKTTTAARTKKEVTPATSVVESPEVEEAEKEKTKDSFASSENALTNELDKPLSAVHDWSNSFHGLSIERFPRDVSDILLESVNENDVEIKPDGIIYLPEIKYRRILNRAFGPGGWGLVPRTDHTISPKNISREYALICSGRFVSQARGEQDYFDVSGLPTASEGCKSNALMRCCKDLGIASELWDPIFIKKFKKKYCTEVWAEHVTTKKKKKLWRKKDDVLEYPYKEN